MGWAVGYDDNWKRDIGYGVPCECDHPDCKEKIHRGVAYVCGGEPYGGDQGCGLYFCGDHLFHIDRPEDDENEEWCGQLCERCRDRKDPFEAKPDIRTWLVWKFKHPSWRKWREENPEELAKIRKALGR